MGYNNNESPIVIDVGVPQGNLGVIWNPPTQPAGAAIANDGPTATVAEYEALWEGLRSAFPAYITRTSPGKDGSATYDWWVYKFEPTNYEKTIILSSNVHGNEYVGMKVLYRFMYHICYSHSTHAQLDYLRNRVRIIVMPICNPYGLANNTRNNSNNVNLNRNFDYNWAACPDEAKGASAASETETQYMQAVFAQYADAISYIDLHNTDTGETNNYYVPMPSATNVNNGLIRQIIEQISPVASPVLALAGTDYPYASAYASYNYDMQALTPEWTPGTMSTAAQDAEDMGYALKFLGNVIIQYSQIPKPSAEIVNEGNIIRIRYDNATVTHTSTDYVEISDIAFAFAPKVPGILEMWGTFGIYNDNAAGGTYLTSAILQTSNTVIPNSDIEIGNQKGENEVYAEFNAKRGQLTMHHEAPVRPSNASYGDVLIKFYYKATAGTLLLRRARIMVKFTPFNGADSYEEWSGTSVPPTKKYPA